MTTRIVFGSAVGTAFGEGAKGKAAARLLMAVSVLAALGACSTFKSLTEPGDAPTQTTYADDDVRRPPLTLPPDFNLRPPSASGVGATDVSASQQARQTVFGLDQEKPAATVNQKTGLSVGESALLQHAGASAATPNIRREVDSQTNALSAQDKAFTDNLLNSNGQSQVPGQAQKQSQGWLQSIFNSNTNQQPTMQRKSGGIFGDLF